MITNGKFCYWDAKSFQDSILIIINLVAATILYLWFLCYFYHKFDYVDYAKFKGIYLAVFGWALTFISYLSFGVLIFFVVGQQQLIQQQEEVIEIYSHIYFIIESLPSLVLQSLLIFIPKNILYNMLQLISLKNIMPDQKHINIYKKIKLYQKVRMVIIGVSLLIMSYPLWDAETLNWISYVKTVLLVIDCAYCIYALGIVYSFSEIASKILLTQNTEEGRRLRREFRILIITCIGRGLVISICYIILPPMKQETNRNCMQPISQHLLFSGLNMIAGPSLTHLIPIMCIIRMYRVDKLEQNLQVSKNNQYIKQNMI